MKMKTVAAALVTAAMAVSALAVTAFAAELPIANANDNGKYKVNVKEVLPAGRSLTDVYGVAVKISGVDTEKGAGGAIAFNSKSGGWNDGGGKEWGNEGSNKAWTYNYTDFTFKRLETESPFQAEEEYAEVFISQWDGWGDAITVESVTLLGKDGSELTAAEETTAAPETTAKQDTTVASTTTGTTAKTTSKSSSTAAASKTGDAGAGVAVAGLGLAAVAAFAARKKH